MLSNIVKIIKGLFRDVNTAEQPEGTSTFTLNGVSTDSQGTRGGVANEESNEVSVLITSGYIIIGKVYIGEGRICIFSTNNINSEIGIFHTKEDRYEVHVNDSKNNSSGNPKNLLNFKTNCQIQAVYRKRRGCEDVVYWVAKNSKPRQYNFSKAESYQYNSKWVADSFNLQKSYSSVPVFNNIEVVESGGNLLPGSYNIAIQYVDEAENPSEWITTSPVVMVYNDSITKDYQDINGSINSDVDFLKFGNTNKSIEIEFDKLDRNYTYYRLAIICANSGSGEINRVYFTEIIPTFKNYFVYTGSNHVTEGTKEEILFFTEYIHRAETIEQQDNKLLLGNTKGSLIDYCRLQKYASRITSDCIIKPVILNSINDKANSKNATYQFNNGLGYMPGEIYSFGIVYMFEDGSISPAYHIPGRNHIEDPNIVYSDNVGYDVYPMSINNEGKSIYLNDNTNCGSFSYWGLDNLGMPLTNAKVRHHRFPFRSEIEVPLVETENSGVSVFKQYFLNIKISGDMNVPVPCVSPGCGTDEVHFFYFKLDYKVDGQSYSKIITVSSADFADGVNVALSTSLDDVTNFNQNSKFEDIKLYYLNSSGSETLFSSFVDIDENTTTTIVTGTVSDYYYDINGPTTVTVIINWEEIENEVEGRKHTGNIFGICFSNIDKPDLIDTNGINCIGYYIVRNERTEIEKTVLDTMVLFPTVKNKKYLSQGLLQPDFSISGGSAIDNLTYGLLFPEFKFLGKKYHVFTRLVIEGNYNLNSRKYGLINYDDVYDGSSFIKDEHDKNSDDASTSDGDPYSRGYDGWSINILTRDNIVSYIQSNTTSSVDFSEVENLLYLDALEFKYINNNSQIVYNTAADNKIGIINFATAPPVLSGVNLPYGAVVRDNADSYSNFRLLPYYKETVNMEVFDDNTKTSVVFGGDVQISPMRYLNTMFWDNRVAKRGAKKKRWKIVVGIVLMIGAVVLAPFTGGTSLLIGTAFTLMGAGALFLSSGIKAENFYSAYSEAYDKGLRETVMDDFVSPFYKYENPIGSVRNSFGYLGTGGTGGDGPSDDTLQWTTDCISDLWFETTVNMSLRNKFLEDASPTFLSSPGRVESGNNAKIYTVKIGKMNYVDSNRSRYSVSSLEKHIVRKLLVFNDKRDDNKAYLGVPTGEYYNINPDYHRKNKEKVYFHLPINYDCCSNCIETFPHRIHWSEQSYQEELSDNYRLFLPNNYRDLEGDTGEVVNISSLNNDLYVFTEWAVWKLPRNVQERVTDQIVSFVGTGEFLSLPPMKMVDDESGGSSGCSHQWSIIKIKSNLFFVSENQKSIFQLGQGLTAISNKGLLNEFKKKLPIKLDKEYIKRTKRNYPNRDNPSHDLGTGFITTYDNKKERLIVTKKDYIFNFDDIDATCDMEGDTTDNYELCSINGQLKIFRCFDLLAQGISPLLPFGGGWTYVGMENCKMKFERESIRQVKRISYNNDANRGYHLIVHFDLSYPWTSANSVSSPAAPLKQVFDNVNAWVDSLDNTYVTDVYYHITDTYALDSQRTWKVLEMILDGNYSSKIYKRSEVSFDITNVIQLGNETNKNLFTEDRILLLNFAHENAVGSGATHPYHDSSGFSNPFVIPSTVKDFGGVPFSEIDAASHKSYYDDLLYNNGEFFGLVYGLFFDPNVGLYSTYKNYIQECYAILRGSLYSPTEIATIKRPAGVSNPEWDDFKSSLMGSLSHNPDGLENYGYSLCLYRSVENQGGWQTQQWLAQDFADDMNEWIKSLPLTKAPIVEMIDERFTETFYIDGEDLDIEVHNNSWTMSYDLLENYWVSYHSYLPNFYLNTQDTFYSFINGNNNIWKHGIIGNYQKFYNKNHPFIVELVSNSNPVVTRVWDFIMMITSASKYDSANEEFRDERFVTFNKVLFYNSRQCSGILNLVVKDTQANPENYLEQQIQNLQGDTIIIDKNEKNWTVNQLRDIRTDYNESIFISNIKELQSDYFIDKIVNENSINKNKSWEQLELFRDKYLVVRLIFDNFEDVNLVLNYSIQSELPSAR